MRIAIARICADGRRRRPRPRCGRRGHPRCSTGGWRSPSAVPAVPSPQFARMRAQTRFWRARCGYRRPWKVARRRWSACGSGPRFRPSPDCTHWRRPTWPTTTGWAVHAATPRSAVGWRCWPTSSPAGHRCPRRCSPRSSHGELLTLEPFGTADGVVARAVSRLVTIASGLDPHGLGVPEVYWMRHSGDYRAAARGFSSGTPDGLAAWLVLSARALHAGAREALAIAQAVSS